MSDTFSYTQQIKGSIPVVAMGYMLRCHKCDRKIVVETGLAGINHNIYVSATCAECVKLDEEFKNKYPEVSDKIEKFINES